MSAVTERHDHLPAPAGPPAPPLRALPPARRRRGAPSARAVALYALGLVAGFLLAGAASLPGGAEIVSGQVGLAVLAAAVAGLAGLRARAVARRRAAAALL